jgi:LemA protein
VRKIAIRKANRPNPFPGGAAVSYIPLILVVGVLAWFVAAYNKLVRLRNQVRNAWKQIDVQLKRRHDLIPNLVEVVKDYMSYEQETLTKVIEARGAAVSARGTAAQAKAENVLTESLKSLFAVVENYPDLKANQNVSSLQEELTGTENKISFARQFYNDSVMTFNNTIQAIPSNMVASLFNFTQEPYFEAEAADREVPKASLR